MRKFLIFQQKISVFSETSQFLVKQTSQFSAQLLSFYSFFSDVVVSFCLSLISLFFIPYSQFLHLYYLNVWLIDLSFCRALFCPFVFTPDRHSIIGGNSDDKGSKLNDNLLSVETWDSYWSILSPVWVFFGLLFIFSSISGPF